MEEWAVSRCPWEDNRPSSLVVMVLWWCGLVMGSLKMPEANIGLKERFSKYAFWDMW